MPCAMCESESAVKVSIEVQVAIMFRPITSYFVTISREEFLTQAVARPPRVLPATVPQPKLVAMEGSGSKF